MTILSIIYSKNGIAIAADSRFTRITHEGDRKFVSVATDNAEKVFLIKNSTAGLVFTGDYQCNGKTWSDLAKSLGRTSKLEKISSDLHHEFKNNSANIKAYIAGYESGKLLIYFVTKEECLKIDEDDYITGYAIDGSTEGVKNFFAKTKLNVELSVLDLAELAEFIVQTEINYEKFFHPFAMCGGKIDVLLITNDYAKFLKHKILQP